MRANMGNGNGREPRGGQAALAAVGAGLGTAVLFEPLSLLATQDKSVRAASPWQDDPYDAVVGLAEFAVPVLALVIALRLTVWWAPGGPDRAQQTVRAAGAATAFAALAAGFEWAALLGGRHRADRDGWTWLLTGGLAAVSLLVLGTARLLVRGRSPLGSSAGWRHDWLGDALLVTGRVPVLRRWAAPGAAAWVRAHAWTVFVTLSVCAAAALTAAQAVGERWTDPLLIAWMLVALTASHLAFCVVSNTLAGFVTRPPRSRARRVAEASVVTGCVALQAAITFRAGLLPAVGSRSLSSVPVVAAVTVGAGLAAATATAAALTLAGRARPPRDTAVQGGWKQS
ncbi:hypothetical protein [Actinacidiphila rubida]|nr:hypothetical protein [Actinacidiphila rubida]